MRILEGIVAITCFFCFGMACRDIFHRGEYTAMDWMILGLTSLFITVIIKEMIDSSARNRFIDKK